MCWIILSTEIFRKPGGVKDDYEGRMKDKQVNDEIFMFIRNDKLVMSLVGWLAVWLVGWWKTV